MIKRNIYRGDPEHLAAIQFLSFPTDERINIFERKHRSAAESSELEKYLIIFCYLFFYI